MKAEEAEIRSKDYRSAHKACSLDRMLVRGQDRLPLGFLHCVANQLESGRSRVGSFHPVVIEGLNKHWLPEAHQVSSAHT